MAEAQNIGVDKLYPDENLKGPPKVCVKYFMRLETQGLEIWT